jgi:hypothetical protein
MEEEDYFDDAMSGCVVCFGDVRICSTTPIKHCGLEIEEYIEGREDCV